MIFNIANKNILTLNIPEKILNTDYFKAVSTKFGVSTYNDIDIKITIVENLKLPNHLKKRENVLYGEKYDDIYISSDFFKLSFNTVSQLAFLQLKQMEPSSFYLLKAIKLILSIVIIKDGGIPFHCSAIYGKNEAYVFTGLSGSGKTTAAFLLNLDNYKVLNDEFNIILPKGNDYKIYSTPFTTKQKFQLCNNLSGMLSEIFFIKKSTKNYITQVSSQLNFTSFIQSLYFFPTTKYLSDKIMHNTELLYHRIRFSQLYFINNKSFISDFNNMRKN